MSESTPPAISENGSAAQYRNGSAGDHDTAAMSAQPLSYPVLSGGGTSDMAALPDSSDNATERRRRVAAARNATSAGKTPEAGAAFGLALDDPALYLNRELSWLAFNERVLA